MDTPLFNPAPLSGTDIILMYIHYTAAWVIKALWLMTHYQVDFVIIPTVCFSWENKQMLEGRKVVTFFFANNCAEYTVLCKCLDPLYVVSKKPDFLVIWKWLEPQFSSVSESFFIWTLTAFHSFIVQTLYLTNFRIYDFFKFVFA